MNKHRITKTLVDSIQPPATKGAQAFYRDTAIPGFGLRVTGTGAKSFIIEKRINGKVKRITLGRYGVLTVEQARNQAMKVLGEIATGHDPIAEKKNSTIKGTTLQETFDDYLLTRKDLKPGTIQDYTRCLRSGCADWLNKPLTSITKDMVEIRHRELGKRSHARANNTMRVLRALFNHARHKFEDADGNPLILSNPVDRLSRNRAWYKVARRQTLIKPHQLKPWYEATLQLNALTTRDYLHLLLFTGLRRNEASRLTWADIEFKDRSLTIEETKNSRVHTLPFSTPVETLLQRRFEERTSVFVFPSGSSDCGYLSDPRTAIARVADLSGVTFTPHDLRRTFITIAESLDIPGYALKQLLNHKNPNDVTAGYIISDVNRLRKPMQQIADYILAQIKEEHSGDSEPNLVQFPFYLRHAANG